MNIVVVISADRGFYGDDNIRRLVEEGAKFILPVPSSVAWHRMIFNLLRIPYMWKGKKVSWVDSETVEMEAQTDETRSLDIAATAATDQTYL